MTCSVRYSWCEWPDADGDGGRANFDCDDTDPSRGQYNPEVFCQGFDQNCDGVDLFAMRTAMGTTPSYRIATTAIGASIRVRSTSDAMASIRTVTAPIAAARIPTAMGTTAWPIAIPQFTRAQRSSAIRSDCDGLDGWTCIG
jgi:hypothetical protein